MGRPMQARLLATRATRKSGERGAPMRVVDDDGSVAGRDSFEAFVAARSRSLLRTSYLLTHDAQLAEDLLQTALAKAWSAWSRVDSNAEAYVRKTIVNTYASWWRRKWNGESPTETLPETVEYEEGAGVVDVRIALRRLPKRQRAVIVLRFFEDLTEGQTAAVLDCSIGTVKSQTSKALAKLRVDPVLAPEIEGKSS